MQQTLTELGHPQPPTPMQTDNATAHALLTNKILPKALKAMDMRFHWLRCRDAQGQFRYYWQHGTQTSEVEPCPLLPFYCANSSCLYVLWDYQYVFDIDMCVIHLVMVHFNLLVSIIKNNVRQNTFFDGFSCPMTPVPS